MVSPTWASFTKVTCRDEASTNMLVAHPKAIGWRIRSMGTVSIDLRMATGMMDNSSTQWHGEGTYKFHSGERFEGTHRWNQRIRGSYYHTNDVVDLQQ